MKKIMILVAAAGLLVATPSCKKGENDPGLSLKSRKARLAGEYSIDSWERTRTSDDGDSTTTSVVFEFEGMSGTEVSNSTSGGTTFSQTKNISVDMAEFSVTKEGTWSIVFNTTTTYSEEGEEFFGEDRIDYVIVETLEQEGIWSFLGGENDEFKNKERVAFDVLTETYSEKETETTVYLDGSTDEDESPMIEEMTSYTAGDLTMTYEIDMLKSDEIVLVQSSEGESNSSVTIGSVTVTNDQSMTSSAKMVLEAK